MDESSSTEDIAASAQSCIAAFMRLLQHRTTVATLGPDLAVHRLVINTAESSTYSEEIEARSTCCWKQLPGADILFEEAEVAFARFKIWTNNLKVLEQGSSALDVCLLDSNVMRIAIVRILDSLQENLNECEYHPTCA
jgi:hypothetical protein